MSNRPTNSQREEVSKRAKGLCEYCLSPEEFSNSTFEVEHIHPLSKGGETVWKISPLLVQVAINTNLPKPKPLIRKAKQLHSFTIREKTFGKSILFGAKILRKLSA